MLISCFRLPSAFHKWMSDMHLTSAFVMCMSMTWDLHHASACKSTVEMPLFFVCSGESNGTAYVLFEDAAMAKDAYEKYNNVALDGKPMKIAFDRGSTRTLTSGIKYVCLLLHDHSQSCCLGSLACLKLA